MGLYLALSCLQGRPMDRAYAELSRLADGVQLTPGNEPVADFAVPAGARTHHGFSPVRRAVPVWSDDGRCLVRADSVHPPRLDSPGAAGFEAHMAHAGPGPAVETMYPGYLLGDGAALVRAVERGWPLAVDVSHLFIMLGHGVLSPRELGRVLDADTIVEVHVSDSDGRVDCHRPLSRASFGLSWARARLAAGTPVILESYLHRLSLADRMRQVDLVREENR